MEIPGLAAVGELGFGSSAIILSRVVVQGSGPVVTELYRIRCSLAYHTREINKVGKSIPTIPSDGLKRFGLSQPEPASLDCSKLLL